MEGRAMTRGSPMLVPERDLKGATPLTLARALLRPLRPATGRKPVAGDQVAVEKVPTDEAGDGIPHLGKRA